MAQDVKFVILVTKDALLLRHIKCGERPYLFATILANTKILLDIADLGHQILAWRHLYTAWVKFPCPNKIDHFIHNDRDRKSELLSLSLRYFFISSVITKM